MKSKVFEAYSLLKISLEMPLYIIRKQCDGTGLNGWSSIVENNFLSWLAQKPVKVEALFIPTSLNFIFGGILTFSSIDIFNTCPFLAIAFRDELFETVWAFIIPPEHSCCNDCGTLHFLFFLKEPRVCKTVCAATGGWRSMSRWQCLNFFPDLHQQRSFRPGSFMEFLIDLVCRVGDEFFESIYTGC